jgi:hypothetical protein
MVAWEWLETELSKQVDAIKKKEGFVVMAHNHVSPEEITKGIATIPHQDLSFGTATEEDVKQGKVFFSGDSTPRIGTAMIDSGQTNALFMAPYEEVSYDGETFVCVGNLLNGLFVLRSEENIYAIRVVSDGISDAEEYVIIQPLEIK